MAESERAPQHDLEHCIFPPRSSPPSADAAWRTRDVQLLAWRIYDVCAWQDMPILADALEDAGCDQPAVLDHCRGGGPHACGCWVLTLLRAREQPPV
jgi:hypothetical protein